MCLIYKLCARFVIRAYCLIFMFYGLIKEHHFDKVFYQNGKKLDLEL